MIRSRRTKPRRGHATTEETAEVRLLVYERSGGVCELNFEGCKQQVLPWDGEVFWRAHLVHLKSVGSGGATDLVNCRLGCPRCHLQGLHVEGGKGKIIPRKS